MPTRPWVTQQQLPLTKKINNFRKIAKTANALKKIFLKRSTLNVTKKIILPEILLSQKIAIILPTLMFMTPSP